MSIKADEHVIKTNNSNYQLDNQFWNNSFESQDQDAKRDWYNMQPPKAPSALSNLVKQAGIEFNGSAPWDVQVYHKDAYRQILSKGSLGFGEAYMEGLWDAEALDELFTRLVNFDIDQKVGGLAKLNLLQQTLRYKIFNLQSIKRAYQVGEQHYDIGNDVFEAMLDPTMSYSCGYWDNCDTLEQAQLNKLDMICRKLELKPGEELLEIGCGWGGLAQHAAKHYGVKVVGITISKEQYHLARQRCVDLPVKIVLMDYRELEGQFDKVVSVGMFEHVGTKNYATYFDNVARLMKPDGLFLLHTIGSYCTTPTVDPWIDKYIFPNGKLPSAKEITAVIEKKFLIDDWHNFGQDYDKTLMAWLNNFNQAWPELKDKYGQRFYRMWKYYLSSTAGFFRCRQGQLWQIVMNKRDRRHVYRSVR